MVHVLQPLTKVGENWRSPPENNAGDDILHSLCVRERFQRSLELTDMFCSGEREKRRFTIAIQGTISSWAGLPYRLCRCKLALLLQRAYFMGKLRKYFIQISYSSLCWSATTVANKAKQNKTNNNRSLNIIPLD